MPAADTIQLPAATNKLTIVNFPIAGGWIGGVWVSIVSWPATATVHELHFIADQGKSSIPTLIRTITPFTMAINHRYGWEMQRYETAMKIRYTSTNNISFCIETNRNAQPLDYM